MSGSRFEVMSRRCNQCLMSRNKIVSDERRRQIIAETTAEDKHFICHKTPKGRIIACRGHEDAYGPSLAHRLGMALGIKHEVDPTPFESADKQR